MELLKNSTVYLNSKKNGGSVNIPKPFFDTNKLNENREIEIHSETLEDGRKALVIIPKLQPSLVSTGSQAS